MAYRVDKLAPDVEEALQHVEARMDDFFTKFDELRLQYSDVMACVSVVALSVVQDDDTPVTGNANVRSFGTIAVPEGLPKLAYAQLAEVIEKETADLCATARKQAGLPLITKFDA